MHDHRLDLVAGATYGLDALVGGIIQLQPIVTHTSDSLTASTVRIMIGGLRVTAALLPAVVAFA
ncbi:hypothetical protein [Streptomyces sp. NPDC018045]|uniref:hypothetical protein n=1 Tax=Streptomyces sp. NPDC018045 TaxID=3365037 RepID=UPI00378BA2F9